jgi:F420-non-reducing hydrogenase iron-sulfur subunit
VTAGFEPRIVGFLCNWCAYKGADAAGRAHLPCPSNFTPIRVMCSGRVDPQFVLDAFANGADGVLILGCHPGDCHYRDGNDSAMRRNVLLRKVLAQFGVEEERMRLDWVSANEGERYTRIVTEMVEQLRVLGPRGGEPSGRTSDAAADRDAATACDAATGPGAAAETDAATDSGGPAGCRRCGEGRVPKGDVEEWSLTRWTRQG